MAGTQPGFDSDGFREAIRFVFEMGSPPKVSDQVSFHFANQLVYTGAVDGDGVPFDPNSTVQRITVPPVRIDCGVEAFDASGERTAFGDIIPTRVETTMFDEEYEQVKTAEFIVSMGEKFTYQKTKMPSGLFDVGLYTMVWIAENDR